MIKGDCKVKSDGRYSTRKS